MAESKKHHYVPQSILRRFSVPGTDDVVWMFDKTTEIARRSNVLHVGMENQFNTVMVAGKWENFEHEFSAVDGAMAAAHKSLVAERNLKRLTPDQLRDLIAGTAVQLVRTKLYRTTMHSIMDGIMSEMARAGMITETLPLMDEQDVRRLARDAQRDTSSYQDTLALLEPILIEPESGAGLWISDNPVVRYNQMPYGEPGLASPGVEVYFPIAPDLALGYVCPTFRKRVADALALGEHLDEPLRSHCAALERAFAEGTATQLFRQGGTAEFLNQLQLRSSNRFLYSRLDDFVSARETLSGEPHLRSVVTMVEVGRIGEGPSQHGNMPPGLHLVVFGSTDHHMVPLVKLEEQNFGFDAFVLERAYVELILNDRPWTEVRVYRDGLEIRGMRQVRGDAVAHGSEWRVRVRHDLPGFQT